MSNRVITIIKQFTANFILLFFFFFQETTCRNLDLPGEYRPKEALKLLMVLATNADFCQGSSAPESWES